MNRGSLTTSFCPFADLFSLGQPRQVSLACSPNFPHFSHFVCSSLCISTQSWEEKEYCFGNTRAG